MPRFRHNNTDGYTAAELIEMNIAFETASADYWTGSYLSQKSWEDHVAEEIQFRFDQGKRGDELLCEPI